MYKYKPKSNLSIGLVGKYVELQDSYKSILEALTHLERLIGEVVVSIHSEFLDQTNSEEKLKSLDGLIVAPGFGGRGIEGKIDAITYVRENKIPFFGICFGMQMAVIEYTRNILNHKNANSTEINENTDYPVIDLMESQKGIVNKGGTMRLGTWDCKLIKGSKAAKVYGQEVVNERHRHRYEFNNEYFSEVFDSGSFKVAGVNPKTNLLKLLKTKITPGMLVCNFTRNTKVRYLILTLYLLILLKQVLTILAKSNRINTNGRKKI